MNIDRCRPPKDCHDLGLWLSGTVNDALRDAREAGLASIEAAAILDRYATIAKNENPLPPWVRIPGLFRPHELAQVVLNEPGADWHFTNHDFQPGETIKLEGVIEIWCRQRRETP